MYTKKEHKSGQNQTPVKSVNGPIVNGWWTREDSGFALVDQDHLQSRLYFVKRINIAGEKKRAICPSV